VYVGLMFQCSISPIQTQLAFTRSNIYYIRCFVSPCHHHMVRSRFADGEEGVSIVRVAGIVLNM